MPLSQHACFPLVWLLACGAFVLATPAAGQHPVRQDAGTGSPRIGLERLPLPSPEPQQEIDLWELLRPRAKLWVEAGPEVDGIAVNSAEASLKMPLYPIFGPPPPMITGGYAYTQINAPAALDLPTDLHEFSLGASWMRKINDRWLLRFMLTGAFASDLHNTSSDAWQLRGGGFAIYQPNDRWSFAFGAIATGRDDLPMIPAVGAIWEPTPYFQLDLMMPRPRISVLLWEAGGRQHWGYLGGGLAGGTWAYQRAGRAYDRVSYGDWRLVLGWEWKARQPPGTFRPRGPTLNAEIGYRFAREFEFDRRAEEISVDDAAVIGIGGTF